MRTLCMTLGLGLLIAGLAVAQEGDEEAPAAEEAPASEEGAKLETDMQRQSYAVGVSIGRGLKRDGAKLDPQLVGQGLAAAFAGEKLELTDAEIRAAVIALKKSLQGADQTAAADKSTGRREKGEAFLKENKDKEGVVTLASGLQYRVIKEGDGDKPKATDRVRTHYRGRLVDDTEFDSSYKRNEPADFGVNEVIAGWTEALQLMKVGSKWELYVPAELGYGETPRPGGEIKPGDMLIFEIELLDIL